MDIKTLAQSMCLIILIIATLVNTSLLRIKWHDRANAAKDDTPAVVKGMRVPFRVPGAGVAVSSFFAYLVFADLIGF